MFKRDMLTSEHLEDFGSSILDIVFVVARFDTDPDTKIKEAGLENYCTSEPRGISSTVVPTTLMSIPVDLLEPFEPDEFNYETHVKPYLHLLPEDIQSMYA